MASLTVVIVVAGLLVTSTPRHAAAISRVDVARLDLPTANSVVGNRFVKTVKLDRGLLTVTPVSRRVRPRMKASAAATQIWSTEAIMGAHPVAFRFGSVTITLRARGVRPVRHLLAWVGFVSEAVGDASGSPAVVYTARRAICGFAVQPARVTRATT